MASNRGLTLTSTNNGIPVYETLLIAQGQSGSDNDLIYVVETESFYRYEANGGAYTIDGINVLSTADGGNTRWLRQPGSSSNVLETYLSITSDLAANTVLDVTASGAGWVWTGDTGNLGSSAPNFANTFQIKIFRNGIEQKKGFEAIWDSSTTFHLVDAINNTEEIKIESI